MARYAVGSFTRPAGTGLQTIPIADSLGAFTPKAVLLWGTQQGAAGFTDSGQWHFGFSDAVSQRGTSGFFIDDAQFGPGPFSHVGRAAMATTRTVYTSTDQPTTIGDATTVVSFGAGTVELNWDTITGAVFEVHFLAIGGDDISAKVGTVLSPASPGAVSVSGLAMGSAITALLLLPVVNVTTDSTGVAFIADSNIPSLGWSNGVAHGAATIHVNEFVSDVVQVSRYQRSDRAFVQQGRGTNSAEVRGGTAGGFTADGFTLTFTTADVGIYGNAGVHYLALAGPQVAVGTTLQPASAGTVTGLFGFNVGAALFMSVGAVASGAVQDEFRFSFGAIAEANQRGSWVGDLNGLTTPTASITARGHFIDRVVTAATPAAAGASSSVEGAAAAAIISGGLSLSWSVSDGVAREVLYLAIEGEIEPPPPPPPGGEGCANSLTMPAGAAGNGCASSLALPTGTEGA